MNAAQKAWADANQHHLTRRVSVDFDLAPADELTLPTLHTEWLLADLLAVHGCLLLSLKHPQNRGYSATVATAMCRNLEVFFERAGIPAPPGGWGASG